MSSIPNLEKAKDSQNILREDSQISDSSDLENTLKKHPEFSSTLECALTREDLNVFVVNHSFCIFLFRCRFSIKKKKTSEI